MTGMLRAPAVGAFSGQARYANGTIGAKLQQRIDVRDFGAKGNGETDDTAALQAAIDEACRTGAPLTLGDMDSVFLIMQPLVARSQFDLPTHTGDLQFSTLPLFELYGSGSAKIKAGAPMGTMLTLIWRSEFSDAAPFQSKIEGVFFDCNDLATECVKSDYCIHITLRRNRFVGAVGAEFVGYGGADIAENVFHCNKGVYFNGGGGDSVLRHNDFYFRGDGDSAIYAKGYGGNTEISANVFNIASVVGTCYAVNIDGPNPDEHTDRNYRVLSNEFYGCVGVRAHGYSNVNRNIHDCTIAHNHTTNGGTLIDAAYCVGLNVHDNFGHGYMYGPMDGVQMKFESCSFTSIHHNKFGNLKHQAAIIRNCSHTKFTDNTLINFGTAGASEVGVELSGTTYNTQVRDNFVIQQLSTYGQNFVVESGGANLTTYGDNTVSGAATPFTRIGALSKDTSSHFKNTASGISIEPAEAKHIFISPGGFRSAQFTYIANAANYPAFNPTAAGIGWVDYAAYGADANLHLRLLPKGADGRVWIGGKASELAESPAAFTPYRMLEVLDANGVKLHIPAMAAPW